MFQRLTPPTPWALLATGALLLPGCSQSSRDSVSLEPGITSARSAEAVAISESPPRVLRVAFEFEPPPLPSNSSPGVEPIELGPAQGTQPTRLPVATAEEPAAPNEAPARASSRNPLAGVELIAPNETVPVEPPAAEAMEEVNAQAKFPNRLPPVEIDSLPDAAPTANEGSAPEMARLTPVVEGPVRMPPVAPEMPENNFSSADAISPASSPALPATGSVTSEPMKPVVQQAESCVRAGVSLAERGAFYSARAQFIQALRLLAQAHDTAAGVSRHSQALAAGLRALKEVDDFVPGGSRLEANINVASVVSAHRTPVLKGENVDTSPGLAAQQYYTYAQEQLALACASEPAGSWALYSMGRLYSAPETAKLMGPSGRSQALAMLQAALLVDSRNHMAANELGVLLAHSGQWEAARQALEHGVSQSRRPEILQNLAVVYTNLGQVELASRTQREAIAAAPPGSSAAPLVADNSRVRWLEPGQFARTAAPSELSVPAGKPASGAAKATNETARTR